MGDLFPVAAASFSGDIDSLFTQVTILMGICFFITEIGLFYFLIRFRKKEGVRASYFGGDTKKSFLILCIPLALFVAFDASVDIATATVWHKVKQSDPVGDDHVRIVGEQWLWNFQHAGPDGEFDTADDIKTVNELHVKTNKITKFYLQSKDVLHNFSVPVFRLKQDAVPGREIKGWFKPIMTGEWDIQCAEMCGISHGDMAARIFVHTDEEYDSWLKEQS